MSERDHELMRRCRDDDAAAFEELVRRWEGPVSRVLTRLAGPNGEAEDLCQEVFLRVLGARNRYRPCGAFSTWLYRIVWNLARDSARRWRTRDHSSVVQSPRDSEACPAEAAARQELLGHVDAALEALPAHLRDVLVLKHFGELSFVEVARISGLPTSTVKSRVHTALVALRKELKRRGIDQRELQP